MSQISDTFLLEDYDEFVRQTQCSYEHAVKALDRLREGFSLEQIVRSYERYMAQEQEIGKKLAGDDSIVKVYTMADCRDDMLHDLVHGKEKGTTTYIPALDNFWTWRCSEFNIWTGYSNEGKSLFLRYLALIKCIEEDWKFAFYAPEDYPAKEFFDDLIHTASGYSTDKENPNFIGREKYEEVMAKLQDYIHFVYIRPPHNTLVEVLKAFIPLIEKHGVKGCVIDPIIKITRPKEFNDRDDRFAAYATTLCTDFSRQFNVSLHQVMHQITPRAQENGLYPKPSMYNIKGGGTWADGTDNILSIQRPFYALDQVNDEVIFASRKIKKQKLVGLPGEHTMRFNRRTNRYTSHTNHTDLYDFDSKLGVPRMRLLFNPD